MKIIGEKNENGLYNGYCEAYYDDGNVYKGEMVNSLRNGFGEMKYADGGSYVGYWKDDAFHGKGVQVWPNGGKFDGEYNMYNALRGTLQYSNGAIYRGTLQNWNRVGYGELFYTDGGSYAGEWRNNLYHGKGKAIWPDGTWYEGEFVDGQMTGAGALYYSNNKIKYQGRFKNGLYHGRGLVYRETGIPKFGGDFYVVHKPEKLAQLCACATNAGLEPKRLRLIRHRTGGPVILILLQCRKGGKPGLVWEENCLQDTDGIPTAYYRNIYLL
jgi:hypothetical protein